MQNTLWIVALAQAENSRFAIQVYCVHDELYERTTFLSIINEKTNTSKGLTIATNAIDELIQSKIFPDKYIPTSEYISFGNLVKSDKMNEFQ